MQPSRHDAARLHEMLQFAEEVRVIVDRAAGSDYLADFERRRALERCIELVGEAAHNVSEQFQQAHPEIPWREVIAQRHRLIHGYRDIDVTRVRNVIEKRLPELAAQIRELLPEPPPDPEPEP